MEQAIVRLVSGKIDAHQAAELPIPLNTPPTPYLAIPQVGMHLSVFVDLATGQPADALARMEVFSPDLQLRVDEYPVVWVQLRYTATLATAGRTDAALDVLENLVSSGWRGDNYNKHLGFTLCCDVRFDAIRDHERFRAITATIEADMAQQLGNVREMQRRGEVPTLDDVNALIPSARECD